MAFAAISVEETKKSVADSIGRRIVEINAAKKSASHVGCLSKYCKFKSVLLLSMRRSAR